MEKTITLEIPQEEAVKFSEELARLVAQMEKSEAESRERDTRFWQMSAEFDQMIASIKRSLDNVEKFRSASIANLHRQ
jgi:hypothetical protein